MPGASTAPGLRLIQGVSQLAFNIAAMSAVRHLPHFVCSTLLAIGLAGGTGAVHAADAASENDTMARPSAKQANDDANRELPALAA
ncbi:MAG: hypothetical protein JWQ88_592, partial [Rhodoferax sp.]|nr:hypothetical protein [Rhodoferax sp.]